MLKRILICSLVVAMLVPSLRWAHGCTVAQLRVGDTWVVARNHDWPFGEGWIIVNPRGLSKTGLATVKPASWTARYGSVSMTQFGRGFPFAGMNEKGLTVDLLQLDAAGFASSPGKDQTVVNTLQWVQYQLDNCASVDEVVQTLDIVVPIPLIRPVEKVHYFVTDAAGNAAVIEYLDGKPKVFRGPSANHCALANSVHRDVSAGGIEPPTSRYNLAVAAVRQNRQSNDANDAVEQGLAVLDSVASEGLTQWSLVYRPEIKRIDFRTKTASQMRHIHLDALSFEADSPAMILDINADASGDVGSRFRPITREDHRMIIDSGFDQYLPQSFSRDMVKGLAAQSADRLLKPATAGTPN